MFVFRLREISTNESLFLFASAMNKIQLIVVGLVQNTLIWSSHQTITCRISIKIMVSNATFNNISVNIVAVSFIGNRSTWGKPPT
jgi:hypothetical protein